MAFGDRLASQDFSSSLFTAAGIRQIGGIWSNNVTMWVHGWRQGTHPPDQEQKIFAFNLANKTRDATKDIDLPAGNYGGIWSDGVTMWIVDYSFGTTARDGLMAFNLLTRLRSTENDFSSTLDNTNVILLDIWSDGTTLWILESRSGSAKLAAYNLLTKARDATKDINNLLGTWSEANFDAGIFGFGGTIWVANALNNMIHAYNIERRERDSSKDFTDTDDADIVEHGLWGNPSGRVIWVSDTLNDQLAAYDFVNAPSRNTFLYTSLPFARTSINNNRIQSTPFGPVGSIQNDSDQNILALANNTARRQAFIYLKQSAIPSSSNARQIKVREAGQDASQAITFNRQSTSQNITYNNEVYRAYQAFGSQIPSSSTCVLTDRVDNNVNVFDSYVSTPQVNPNIRKSTDLVRRFCGTQAIGKYYLGTRLVWQQSNPPTITSFTATPSTLDLDTATGNITLRVAGTNFTAGKFVNKRTGEVIINFASTTGTSSVSTPIPNQTTTYTVILTNSTGAVSQDVTVTATKNPTIESFQSDGQLASRLPSGGTFRFSAVIDGLPRPAIRADQGIGAITDRHLTRRSDGKWDLTFTHYFGVSGSRQITLTATNSSGSVTAQTTIVVP